MQIASYLVQRPVILQLPFLQYVFDLSTFSNIKGLLHIDIQNLLIYWFLGIVEESLGEFSRVNNASEDMKRSHASRVLHVGIDSML